MTEEKSLDQSIAHADEQGALSDAVNLPAAVVRQRREEISTVIDTDVAASPDSSLDPETARVVAQISELRQSIDNIDNAVVSLLAERFKATAQVGVLKAQAGFAPADFKRENRQMTRLRRVADEAGLDVEIAEKYREFVVEEAKKRHRRIAEEGENPGVLDLFA